MPVRFFVELGARAIVASTSVPRRPIWPRCEQCVDLLEEGEVVALEGVAEAQDDGGVRMPVVRGR